MGLFRRGRKTDSADSPVDAVDALDAGVDTDPAGTDGADGTDGSDGSDARGLTQTSGSTVADDEVEERFNRTRGPFDGSEVVDDDEVARIDLGSMLVAPVEGMQLRLELDQAQESVVSAHALLGDSSVQLQVFAAPRTLGVWPDIRSEIADSVRSQGGSADVVTGPLGRELVAGIPSRGADGRTVQTAVRFLGVDGPRWFLRAVISGPAATDEAKAGPLVDLVRSVVVIRDDEARPPREALPLRVPAAVSDAAGEPDGSEGSTGPEGPDPSDRPHGTDGPASRAPGDQPAERPVRSADDLRPFERGPEITEVR